MAEKEVSPGGINTEKINGGQETPVIENNPPREQLKIGSKFVSDEDSNRETDVDGDLVVGKDLYVDGKMKIGGEIIEGDLEVDGELNVKKDTTIGTGEDNADLDVYGDLDVTGTGNIAGDTNIGGKTTIGSSALNKNLKVYGNIEGNDITAFNMNPITKLGTPISQADFLENLNPNVTLSNFSAYKVGQFIYLSVQFTSSNYTGGDNLFTIKDAYKPKVNMYYSQGYGWSNWGGVFNIYLGSIRNIASTTGTNSSCNIYSLVYEIA